jgi:hypothetical protein
MQLTTCSLTALCLRELRHFRSAEGYVPCIDGYAQKTDYIEDFVATQQRNGRRFVRRVDKTDRYELVSAEVAFEKTLSELNTTLAPEDKVLAYLQPTHMLRLFSPTGALNRT